MAKLEVMNKTVESFRSLTLDEVDRLNELIQDVEATLGVFTMLDVENTETFELAYLIRLADKGIDALKEAFNIINKE